METGKALYTKFNDIYVLKLTGKIRYTLSADIDNFLTLIFKKNDFENILIDLSETTFIDSTNLGLLAKAANFMRRKHDKKVTIIANFDEVNEILTSVRFNNIFLIISRSEEIENEMSEIPHVDTNERELAKIMLDAHRQLTVLNSKNQELFKDIVELLEKDLE